MKYTKEQIEAIAGKLRKLPPIEKKKEELSKFEVVKALSKEIAGMQKKGYSFEQISNALKESGLDIATPTLKSYLQRSKHGTAKRKVQPKTDTAQPAENTDNADTESQS
jgi:hypothetical protein